MMPRAAGRQRKAGPGAEDAGAGPREGRVVAGRAEVHEASAISSRSFKQEGVP